MKSLDGHSNFEIGLAISQYGTVASPETITRVAVEAENVGCASLWVSDRLLLPVKPRDTFGDGPWPDLFATVYDPIETLTYIAARTKSVKLPSRVIDALFHNPVILARRFATLDRLSGGRAIAGIGQGDFKDEFDAANVPMTRRGRGFEEFVLAMRAAWGPDPVTYSGKFYRIPESKIGPKPVQPGGVPLIVGAFAPKALERAARIADGIFVVAGRRTKLDDLRKTIESFRNDARRAGRNPEHLQVILRAHTLQLDPLVEPRAPFIGTAAQIREDKSRLEELGIHHAFFDMLLDEIPVDTQLVLLRKLMRSIRG